jgi:hypothetical protein
VHVSGACAVRRAGSSPALGTFFNFDFLILLKKIAMSKRNLKQAPQASFRFKPLKRSPPKPNKKHDKHIETKQFLSIVAIGTILLVLFLYVVYH